MDGFTTSRTSPPATRRAAARWATTTRPTCRSTTGSTTVLDRRPLLLVGAEPDVPEPFVPAGGNVVRPHPQRRAGTAAEVDLRSARRRRSRGRSTRRRRRYSYGSLFFKYVTDRRPSTCSRRAVLQRPREQRLPTSRSSIPQTGTPKTENDEHPPANVQVGQKFVADIINGLMSSSSWATSAMFFTYDEHGGYYDHVVPPAAVPPDESRRAAAG